jgi:hypothetical protein
MKKMKNSSLLLFGIFVAFTFAACDEITGPYTEEVNVTEGGRKILLEDFTGHECGNCPYAGIEATNLDSIYKGRVIVVATHCSFFADTNKTGKFSYNFKTLVGDELDQFFNIETAGLPKGMVNRQALDGDYSIFSNRLLNYTAWGSSIAMELNKKAALNLSLSKSYDTLSRNLNLEVEIEYLEKGNINQQLVVYLVEDSIINWQKWYGHIPENVPDFAHRHVLRTSLNGAWGDRLSGSVKSAGQIISKSYTTTISSKYKQKKCYIVAFVQNNLTKEVLQVEEIKLIE